MLHFVSGENIRRIKGFPRLPGSSFLAIYCALYGESRVSFQRFSRLVVPCSCFRTVRAFDTFFALDKVNHRRNIVSRYDYSGSSQRTTAVLARPSCGSRSLGKYPFCSLFHKRNRRELLAPIAPISSPVCTHARIPLHVEPSSFPAFSFCFVSFRFLSFRNVSFVHFCGGKKVWSLVENERE